MPIVAAEYLPPGAPREAAEAAAPCCSKCASPEERAAAETRGQALVRAALARAKLAARSAGLGAEEEEPFWATPGWVEAYVEKTGTEIWTLATDYSKAIRDGRITQALLQAFKAFFNEWEKWRAGLTSFSYWWGPTGETAKNYRVRALQWRQALESVGVTPTGPAPVIAPPSSATPSQVPSVVKWVAGGAIVVGGAIALGHLVKGAGLLKKAAA